MEILKRLANVRGRALREREAQVDHLKNEVRKFRGVIERCHPIIRNEVQILQTQSECLDVEEALYKTRRLLVDLEELL